MSKDFLEHLRKQEQEWEDLCLRCGACCGAYDDPCKNLRQDDQGKYFCQIYDKRFGLRESVSGEKFDCVHITEILDESWKSDYMCIYKKRKATPHLFIK